MKPRNRRSPLAFLVVSASVAMLAVTAVQAHGVSEDDPTEDVSARRASAVEVEKSLLRSGDEAESDASQRLEVDDSESVPADLTPPITEVPDEDLPAGNDDLMSGGEDPSDIRQSGDEVQSDVLQSGAGQEVPVEEVEGASPFRRARNTPPAFADPNDPSLRPVAVATGGEGKYKDSIFWLEWPAGTLIDVLGNRSGNRSVLTQHSYRDISPRIRLVTSCTISNLNYGANRPHVNAQGPIAAYTPGGWGGDFLDNLYNKGGDGARNTMRIGIKNVEFQTTPTFDLSCEAQVLTRPTANSNSRFTESKPFPIDGLVIADAESAHFGTKAQEWIRATTFGEAKWYVLETISDPQACPIQYPEPEPSEYNWNDASASFADLSHRTMRILPNGNECMSSKGTPGAVLFAQGASQARLTLQGSGTQALALGVIVPSDLGDAPESYGEAVALYHPTWEKPLPEGKTNLHRGDRLAKMGPSKYVLGSDSGHDLNVLYSPLADRDTYDDAISPRNAYFEVYPGETVVKNVRCRGGGAVAGWVDWNLNGKFDSNEKSDEVPCRADSVNLSWTVPMDVLRAVQNENFNPRQTVMRLRTAALRESTLGGGDSLEPTGPTLSGEVEDHGVQLFVPRLKLENKVVSSSPYVTTLRPATDWKVKAIQQGQNPAQNKEFSANGSFTSSVPLGNFVLSVEGANGQPIPGYVNDGWACVKTPNSQAPRRKNYASTFNGTASRLNIPQADHVTCTITHRPIPGELVWRKVDQQGNLLSGSEWQVEGPSAQFGARVVDCKQAPCSAGIGALRDADPRPGVMRVGDLRWGAYTLTETKAPAGYVLSAEVKRANVEGVIDLGEIANEMHQPLVIPLTGGTASIFYVLAGGGLTVAAVAGAAAIGNRGRSRG